MDAATLEETNRLRISLGLKTLPIPGAPAAAPRDSRSADDSDDEPASTLESRQAQAYDNFKKLKDAEDAKLRREQKATAAKKAREAAQRFALLGGRGLADDDDGDDVGARAWLLGQKKRQKKIDRSRREQEEGEAEEKRRADEREYTSKDLAGVRVAHDVSAIEGEQILTLKDANVGEDDEGDELENIGIRESERLKEKLDLKKKRAAYNPLDEADSERTLLGQYDEEIYGKKQKQFTLGNDGDITDILGELDDDDDDGRAGGARNRRMAVGLNLDEEAGDAKPSSDYMDNSEIKIKKPKKSKLKKTRQRPVVDDDDMLFRPDATPVDDTVSAMDVDSGVAAKKRKVVDDTFVDDEDLQTSLAIHRQNALKKRKKMRPEDLARQLQEQQALSSNGTPTVPEEEGVGAGGLVLGDVTEFVSGLQKPDGEDRKPKRKSAEPSVQAMDNDDDDDDDDDDDGGGSGSGGSGGGGGDNNGDDGDHLMRDANGPDPTAVAASSFESGSRPELPETGVDVEKTFDQGLGSTLAFLRERKLVEESAENLDQQQRHRRDFLLAKKRLEADNEEWARQQRERDRTSGRLEKMSTREREEWARQQNAYREQQLSRKLDDLYNSFYKPTVELRYIDEHGRSLNQKDAFKELSHQFHGRGSGKGKTDKLLKKIADDSRRERQSMLDASQNIGMSSATAQQTKKRKEAGVRLA